MRSVAIKLGFLLPLAALLGGAAPAAQPRELPSEALVFAAVDGSSWDADGAVDGVWTWADRLTLKQPLGCGKEPGGGECSVNLVVDGDLTLAPGAGIDSSGTVRLAVAGELRLARGSFLASHRGGVEISATGGIRIDGLVSASSGPGRGAGDRARISIGSTGGPGNGIRLGAAAALISEGGRLGGNTIQLSGCGIDVMGLVAAVASGPDAAVLMRSCEGLRVDGRDLERATQAVAGERLGRVEVRGGGSSPRIRLSAADAVVLDGAELRVGEGVDSRIAVVAEQGRLSWRRGRGRVSPPRGAADVEGGQGGGVSGEASGRIRLSACAGFDLAGAEFDPRAELELVDACALDEEADGGREPVSLAGVTPLSQAAPGPQESRTPACTPVVALANETVSTIEEYVACNSVTAENFHIVPRGYVTFRAGQLIVLKDGFSVEGSAQFFAILDPSLNQPPVAQDDAFMIDEDSGAVNGNVLADNGAGVDSDPDGDPLTVDPTPVSGPTSGMLTLLANGDFTYTPNGDFAGVDMFEYEISDGNGGTDVGKVTITVDGVNDAPLFTKGGNQTVFEDAGAQTVNPWATSISPGPADEAGQTVSFNVSNDNNALFSAQPAVSSTGILTYTPAADANGVANVTIEAMDDGGTANGGVDTSAAQLFTITVTPVNDAPALDAISDPAAILEDAAQQTVNLAGIAAGGGETQVLTVTATSDNPGLIPNPTVTYTSANATGSIMYTPVADQSGTATITVTVMDDGGTASGGVDSFSQMFTVTVTAVNEAPTLDAISDPAAILEDAAQQTVNLAGIAAGGGETQVLTVTATSDTPGLIPNPTVSYTSANATGSIMYTPVADQSGTATITVTVMDDGGTANGGVDTSSRMFDVTVTAVNDAPTLDAISDPAAILEDAAQQTVNLAGIAAGGGETQVLTVTATSDTPGLIPNPTVTYTSANATGSIMYTPVADQSGTATITVTVMDDGSTANGGVDTFTRMFDVTVTAVNDAPTLDAITDPAPILKDSPQQTVNFSGVGAGGGETQVLAVTATSDNTGLIPNPTVTYTSPNATGSLVYTPVAGQAGTAVITVTVMDDGGTANGGVNGFTRMFTVTVIANQPPVITTDPIAYTTAGNTQLKGGSGAMTAAVAYVEDADNIPTKAGVSDPDMDALTYSLDSGPTSGSATVSAAGNFLYTPNPGFVGTDSFDYKVFDGVAMVTGTVDITVKDTDGGVAGDQVIWYVENDATGAKDGTSANPFDTLKDAESMNLGAGASDIGDAILVLEGDGTTAKQNAGLVMDDDQKLLGHAAATLVANAVTIQTPSPGGRPKIENGAGDGVEATDKGGIEIRYLDITGSVHGIDVTAVSGTPTLVVDNNLLTGSDGGHGVNVVATGTAAPEVVFSNNTVESTDASFRGANFEGSASSGTLTVTGFAANSVNDTASAVGTGIRVAGVTFDADTGTSGIQQVAAGVLTIGDSAGGMRTMGPGLSLSQVRGDLQFDSVDIFNSDGPGLELDNTGLGAGLFSLAIDDGSPVSKIDTIDGSALDLDPATVDLHLLSATTGTAGAGFAASAIRLVDLAGTVDIDGGSLAGATGTSFAISGGTATVSYSGGITHTGSGAAVSVNGGHSAGVVTFDTGTVSAVIGTGLQFDDADGTYNFNGPVAFNGGDAGIDILGGSGGAFTFGSATLTSPAGIAFNVDGSSATVSYNGGSITQANEVTAVRINGHSVNTVDINVGVTANTGTANAIHLSGVGTVNFDGPLDVDTTTGTGFLATGVGVLNVTNAGNTVDTVGTAALGNGIGISIGASIGGSGVTFNSVNVGAAGKANSGVLLANTGAGTFTVTGGTIQNTTGRGVDLANVDGTVSIGADIQNDDGRSVEITGSAGAITFSGAIDDDAEGIDISTNTGSFTFKGGLDIDSGANTGFRAGSGGTLNICADDNCSSAGGTAAVNTIDVGAAIGLTVSSVNIGSEGLTFERISSSGGANVGIVLNGTGTAAGNGSLTVTGDGSTAASGGTIAGKTGAGGSTSQGIGIFLSNTKSPSFSFMQLNDFSNFAIRGAGVTGFNLADSTINGTNGDSTTDNEGSVSFTNLLGSATITDSNISGGHEDNVVVINDTGTLDRLTVSGGTIGLNATATGNDGVTIESRSSAIARLSVLGTSFLGARGDMVQCNAVDTSTMDCVIKDNTFANAHTNIASGGGGITVSGGGASANIALTYEVSGTTAGSQTFTGAKGFAITANIVSGAGTATGTIRNNYIGTPGVAGSGSTEGGGILAAAAGTVTHTVTIDGNRVRRIGLGGGTASGIDIVANVDNPGGTRPQMNATVTGNNVAELEGSGGFAGMNLTVAGNGTENGILCVDARTNVFDASGGTFAGAAVFLSQFNAASSYNLPGYGGSANGEFAFACAPGTASAGLSTFLTSTNGNTLVDGPFPVFTGVDALTVCGVSGTGSSCP